MNIFPGLKENDLQVSPGTGHGAGLLISLKVSSARLLRPVSLAVTRCPGVRGSDLRPRMMSEVTSRISTPRQDSSPGTVTSLVSMLMNIGLVVSPWGPLIEARDKTFTITVSSIPEGKCDIIQPGPGADAWVEEAGEW